MIYIASPRTVRPDTQAFSIAISNRLKFQQLQSLAPSWTLYNMFREWKASGAWNYEQFLNGYTPVYLQELRRNPVALQTLNWLCSQRDNISLVCFCTDERLCHRSIVAGVLMNMGAQVSASEEYKRFKL